MRVMADRNHTYRERRVTMNATTQQSSNTGRLGTGGRSTVKEDLQKLAAAKAAEPKAKNIKEKALNPHLSSGSKVKPGAASKAHAASVKAAAEAGRGAKKGGSLADKRAAMKDSRAAKPGKAEVRPHVDPEVRKAEKERESAERQAAYQQRINDQKAATVARKAANKLLASFCARVKYMVYMDNPAFGGLAGRESIGWSLRHQTEHGTYVAERTGETVTLTVQQKGKPNQTQTVACTTEAIAVAIAAWEPKSKVTAA
jgi:hypothetical protein